MGLWNDPVDTIINRLEDTLVFSTTGNYVENYPLDLLNRAQNWLSMYRPWDYMKKVQPLTLANYIAVLPADISTILDVYVDSEGAGKPTHHFYKDANDIAERYELFDSFTVETGHSWYIQIPFTAPIVSPLYLKYIYNLANIAEGQAHTFFPSELLFRTAQKIHHEDKGTTGDSIEYTMKAFNELLDSFIKNSQYTNQKMDLGVTDAWGNPVKIPGHSLTGQTPRRFSSPYQNSALLTG